jgi:hypothetical protein
VAGDPVTTRFRLDAVTLDTVEGPVHYPFPSDLTVLAGPTGVGKTTLLELVKFGFGGDGLLAPVVLQSVNDTERCWRRVRPWVEKERARRGSNLYAQGSKSSRKIASSTMLDWLQADSIRSGGTP